MNAPDPPRKPRRTGPFGPAAEIIPAKQELQYLRPDDSLLDALVRLSDEGFNQAPVQDAAGCMGVVRIFGIVKMLLKQQWFQEKLAAMKVRNHVELKPRYIGADEWVDVGFDWQEDDLALVGTPRDLRGMLTATDILRRLTDWAQAFVYLEAIEFHTRELFDLLLPLPANHELVSSALTTEGKSPPRDFSSYSQLDYGHYSLIFGREATFERLALACVWDRGRLAAQIQNIGRVRNMLLHFRGRASDREREELEQFANHAEAAAERARHIAAERGVCGTGLIGIHRE
jgi:CBS domain-containing protein